MSLQDIADLPPLREVIAQADLRAKKGLGQNFLLDLNLTHKIARAAGDLTGLSILEIGAGPGGLTRALLMQPVRRVVAIERDARCIAALQPLVQAADGRLTLIEGDALALDHAALFAPDEHPAIIANLPYNIATPLILGWLEYLQNWRFLHVLVQKEVAARFASAPACKSYGRPSVLAQWRGQVDLHFDISPEAFVPAPKVTSTVMQITPHDPPLAPEIPWAQMERVLAAAFGQRRKMLRQSLKALGAAADLLQASAIAPTLRAEDLSVQDYIRLTRAYHAARC